MGFLVIIPFGALAFAAKINGQFSFLMQKSCRVNQGAHIKAPYGVRDCRQSHPPNLTCFSMNHEPRPNFRQVLECASPLALLNRLPCPTYQSDHQAHQPKQNLSDTKRHKKTHIPGQTQSNPVKPINRFDRPTLLFHSALRTPHPALGLCHLISHNLILSHLFCDFCASLWPFILSPFAYFAVKFRLHAKTPVFQLIPAFV
jgi:hypothetical protein